MLPCADVEPLPVRAHYTCHSSLAYGADWCRLHFHPAPPTDTEGPDSQPRPASQPHPASHPGAPTQRLLASCSFYDHSLQLWRCSV